VVEKIFAVTRGHSPDGTEGEKRAHKHGLAAPLAVVGLAGYKATLVKDIVFVGCGGELRAIDEITCEKLT